MNNIIDGYILFHENQFYNLSPAPYSGAIISPVNYGDILYSFYDMEEAEAAKAQCIHRVEEWYRRNLAPDKLTDMIGELQVLPILDVMDKITELSLVIEPSYIQ